MSTKKDLLSKPVLRYSSWMMALFTFVGNGLVLWGRFSYRDENRAVSLVIKNLAFADIIMGLYMMIIGIQDIQMRDFYFEYHLEWIKSWCCVFAGVLAMISSEVSILILTFMSIERFLLISDPFGGHRKLNLKNVSTCLFIIWMIGISIAIIPGKFFIYRNNK